MALECMIDLETFGLPPDGMIVSIGAVMFDPDLAQPIVASFHTGVDPDAYVTHGLDKKFSINAGTVKWWLDPARDDARRAWLSMPKVDIASALDAFSRWYGDSKPTWGNAVTFDVILMKHAMTTLGIPVPWQFYDERCHRTLKSLVDPKFAKAAFSFGVRTAASGVLHSALFDAEVQAYQNILCRRDPRDETVRQLQGPQ